MRTNELLKKKKTGNTTDLLRYFVQIWLKMELYFDFNFKYSEFLFSFQVRKLRNKYHLSPLLALQNSNLNPPSRLLQLLNSHLLSKILQQIIINSYNLVASM